MSELVRRPESSVAVAEAPNVSPELIVADMIRDVARMDGRDGSELQRWVVKVLLQPKHQYLVRGKSTRSGGGGGAQEFDDSESGGSWSTEWSASPRAEAYDVLNRVMGIQFHVPRTVNDRHGREVPNPIHDRDYLYYRLIGIGYNDLGQLIAVSADVETDFFAAWQQERLKVAQRKMKARDAKDILVRDENGMPKIGPSGELLYRLADVDEFKAADRLHTLRVFGGRMAETIARRRILTQFSGIRTLWTQTSNEKPSLHPVTVTVVGYRDKLTPDERLRQAQEQAKEVFNAPVREKGDPEMQVDEAELADADEERAPESVDADATTVATVEDGQYTLLGDDVASPRALPGEKIHSVTTFPDAKAALESSASICAALAPGSEPQERCMLLLNGGGVHIGPHRSAGYVWPQE